MKSITKAKKLTILLWSLTFVPMLIVFATEANKTVLIGYMRIVDFIDLSVMAPFFLAITLAIHSIIFSEKLSSRGSWISLVLIGILLYGHSMHITANSINTYSTEIKNYKDIIPADTYSLIYFLDEDLGHWLLYGSLFGLLGVWLLSSDGYGVVDWQILFLGCMFGLSYAVAIVESSQLWLGICAPVWLFCCWLLKWHKTGLLLLDFLKSKPFITFVLMTAVCILVGQVIYFFVVGSFTEPSQLGL